MIGDGAVDEATTEYVTRKLRGKVGEKCAYNTGTDVLEAATECMSKYGICDGEKLLFDTYMGDDKELFKKEYNKISGSPFAYNELKYAIESEIDMQQGTISHDYSHEETVEILENFEKKCQKYSQKNNS